MVSKIGKAAGTAQSQAKKPVVPREDPVLRAKRILDETIEKSRVTAEAQLEGAREAVVRANGQLDRWTRIRDELSAKVERLVERAGVINGEGE